MFSVDSRSAIFPIDPASGTLNSRRNNRAAETTGRFLNRIIRGAGNYGSKSVDPSRRVLNHNTVRYFAVGLSTNMPWPEGGAAEKRA